ncbi:CRISPR-associated protein Cas4 [Metallosphaera sedula]|uniref:CRISPR-associated protein Cas4 n=1 Tax=Metallosphaera sedula TaxID=43687 RepID=UPI0020C005A1|nr:CRISPR-associated protein Cas4 [Metallosphaera sedula]BBL47846.1 CRISPR-associated exonuclease Cas4 [Metallosphaera sedula]
MSSLTSVLKNLSLTQTLFKRRLNDKKAHERKENVIYVTDLLYCPLKPKLRERFRELTYAESYNPSTLQGSLIHESVERILREELNAEVEVPISKEIVIGDQTYTILGRADAIKDNVIIEVKTSRADVGIPRSEHVLQVRIYLNLINSDPKWNNRSVQNRTYYGVLLYITPDRVTEFHIEDGISDDELSGLVQDFLYARDTPKQEWECEYCVFDRVCPNKVSLHGAKRVGRGDNDAIPL